MANKTKISAEAMMQALAEGIDEILNGAPQPGRKPRFGFVLMVAEFDRIEGGRVNYVSNGQRESMLAMVREFLARAESRYHEPAKGSLQ